jgi:hypothetical protein
MHLQVKMTFDLYPLHRLLHQHLLVKTAMQKVLVAILTLNIKVLLLVELHLLVTRQLQTR